MRLSEKTIELNFCSQVNQRLAQPGFWFGLTQKEEAWAGFDSAALLGGRVLIFQFKASSIVRRSGARSFRLPHRQLLNLRAWTLGGRVRQSVFYVFPEFGRTRELARFGWDVPSGCWLMDVATLGVPPIPRTKAGKPRAGLIHYAELLVPPLTKRPKIGIHSEPIESTIIRASEFFDEGLVEVEGVRANLLDREVRLEGERPKLSRRGTIALVVPPRG
jgi:hypothetical protein